MVSEMKKDNEGESYITANRGLEKWINGCICCHTKGYKLEMLERVRSNDHNCGTYFIKKYFKPLKLNENGLCSVCEKLVKS